MEERDLLLKYNLQWFAKEGPGGEKTEPATAKKFNCFISGIEDFWKLCFRNLNE